MEEKKEVLAEETPVLSDEEQMKLKEKKAITGFVLAMIGNFGIPILVSFISVIGSLLTIAFFLVPLCYVAGIIICGIGLGTYKKSQGIEKNPHKVLRLLGLIFNIIGIVFNILNIILTILIAIFLVILVIVAAVWVVLMIIMTVAPAALSMFPALMELLTSLGMSTETALLALAALL